MILTGATGGIGRSIARMLVAAGARSPSPTSRRSAWPRSRPSSACSAQPATSPRGSRSRRSTTVEVELGPIGGIVNCAGLWAPAPYDEVDEQAWTETIDANLKTAFVACSAVLPGMVEAGRRLRRELRLDRGRVRLDPRRPRTTPRPRAV